MQINPEFEFVLVATVVADGYARMIGQFPTVVRTDFETVRIHDSAAPGAGGNGNIPTHVDDCVGHPSLGDAFGDYGEDYRFLDFCREMVSRNPRIPAKKWRLRERHFGWG